jgi:hypothetical protein
VAIDDAVTAAANRHAVIAGYQTRSLPMHERR